MASFLDTYNKMSSAPMYSFEGSDKDEMLGAFRKMAQGASLESSDEIEASLRSIFGDKTYKENYDEIHENMDMFEEKYPVADNMAYLTGMASTAAVGFSPKMIQLASKLSPTKLGALVGLFEGTMASEPGLSNRASGGALGTILGGTIGKALEKVSPGVLNLLNKFKTETPPSVLPPETMSDSIQAIRDSAEKLQSKKGALPDNVASFSDAQNNQMISKIKGVLEDMPYTINLPYEIGKKLNSEGRLPLPIGTNMIPPIGKGSPEDVYKISGYKADPNNTNVYGYEITNREGDVSYIGVSDPKMGIKEKRPDKVLGWKAALGPEGSKRLNYTPPDWQRTKKPQIVRTPENQKIIDQEYEDLFEERPDDLTDSIKDLRDSAKKLNFRS